MDPIKTLAEYAANTQFEDLPPEVIEQAKYLILDTIGCALGGSKTELGRVVTETIGNLGGNPEATIVGEKIKTNCVLVGCNRNRYMYICPYVWSCVLQQ